ncbi:hypothetical protein BC826DRAFT_994389 [Russula brevipes]|nr:hypothetical protein BC826DRAFT_994389 [Russula brevipes]
MRRRTLAHLPCLRIVQRRKGGMTNTPPPAMAQEAKNEKNEGHHDRDGYDDRCDWNRALWRIRGSWYDGRHHCSGCQCYRYSGQRARNLCDQGRSNFLSNCNRRCREYAASRNGGNWRRAIVSKADSAGIRRDNLWDSGGDSCGCACGPGRVDGGGPYLPDGRSSRGERRRIISIPQRSI